MTDLRVDVGALRDIGADLSVVAAEFREANVTSAGIAAATGHARLEERVRSFASGWDDTREDMVGGIESLAEVATAIADAFTQVDGDLAAGLSSGGAR
ncbi:hypothetical protein [Georgenia daeguensis]|uniref:WXG100 family type VII secretion target n=1 Tax=Georgenia daeguensis TaxID=908355 RepID=A0ABP8EVC5_9MICO